MFHLALIDPDIAWSYRILCRFAIYFFFLLPCLVSGYYQWQWIYSHYGFNLSFYLFGSACFVRGPFEFSGWFPCDILIYLLLFLTLFFGAIYIKLYHDAFLVMGDLCISVCNFSCVLSCPCNSLLISVSVFVILRRGPGMFSVMEDEFWDDERTTMAKAFFFCIVLVCFSVNLCLSEGVISSFSLRYCISCLWTSKNCLIRPLRNIFGSWSSTALICLLFSDLVLLTVYV